MSEQTLLDLEGMMNDNLDNVPDAPDYANPPAGEYRLRVKDSAVDKYKTKDDPNTEKQRLKNTYEIVDTIQLADTKEPPVPNGTLFTETFQATEQGLGYFKKRIKEIMGASDVAGVTLGDMMQSVKGTEFVARVSIRKTKGKDGTEYENVNLRVVPAAS